ncbi:MAG: hypothetical protein AB1Z98_15795 [Nannocystaceae bacterium]
MQTRTRTVTRLGLATAALLATASLSTPAEARRPNLKRRGGQWGVMLGGSACIPGKADCTRDTVTVDGRTRPSVGMGAELGYRFNRYVFAGAAYDLGFFDTDYEVSGATAAGYRRGFQNSVFGMVRPTLPVWRFDFGLGLGVGFSRQTFKWDEGDDKDYSQGLAFKLAPTIDIFVSRQVFVGAKMDLLLNAHGRTCRQRGSMTNCTDAVDTDLAPVHQMLFGLHIGGTFL